MNDEWRMFLERAGGTMTGSHDIEFSGGAQGLENFIIDLSRLNLLEVSGRDAFEFLNGQFTADLKQLGAETFQFSAWCNPQGRVIAVFVIFRQENSFYILIPAELKDRFIKRLQLYVLRADVIIRDRSEELVRFGIISDDGTWNMAAVPESSGCIRREADLTFLRVDDGPPLRILVVGPVAEMQSLWQSLTPKFAGAGAGLWFYHDLRAGIPWILDSTCEQFLPQELNLDITGGLSYAKGCFPGQEVIARIHYRGVVKQRLHLSEVPADAQQPVPGERLYSTDTDNSIGTVINVANAGSGAVAVLAVADVDIAANNSLHIAGEHGLALKFEAVAR